MDIVDVLIEFIELNIKDNINYDVLIKHFGYSERHLRRLFKKKTNESLYSYITTRKMINAYCDMKMDILNSKEISLIYGYKNYDSFIRAFKRVFGLSPLKINDIKVEIVYKKMARGYMAPIIKNSNYNELKEDYKELYKGQKFNKTTSYLININNLGFNIIDKSKKSNFGEEYIYNLSTKYPLTDEVYRILTKENKSNRAIYFILSSTEHSDFSNEIKDTLVELGFIVVIYNVNDISNNINSQIYNLVELFNKNTFSEISYQRILTELADNKSLIYNKDNIEYLNSKDLLIIKTKDNILATDIYSLVNKSKDNYIDYQIIVDNKIEEDIELLTISLVE